MFTSNDEERPIAALNEEQITYVVRLLRVGLLSYESSLDTNWRIEVM